MSAKIIVRGSWCSLINADKLTLDALTERYSYTVKGFEYTDAYELGTWAGDQHVFRDRHFTVGLLPEIVNFLKDNDIKVEVDDRRQLGQQKQYRTHPDELWPFQLDIVNKVIENKSASIQVSTGGGKTRIAAEFIARLGYKSLFITPSVEILRQTQKVLSEYIEADVGIIGDNERDIKHVTVATWQSLNNEYYNDYLNSLDVLVIDEAQHIAANVLRRVARKIPAIYRLGMSGTLWREDGADLEIVACCGSKAAEMSYTDLINGGYLVPAKITLIKFAKKTYSNWKSYADIYEDYITKNNFRNQTIVNAVEGLIRTGRKVLIFVTKIEHGRILSEMSDKEFVFANHPDRRQLVDNFKSGSLKCLISTSMLNEGVDMPIVDALILAAPQKSMIATIQKIGRSLRKFENKSNAIVVDTYDNCKYLIDGSKRRLDYYRKERAWDIDRFIDATGNVS